MSDSEEKVLKRLKLFDTFFVSIREKSMRDKLIRSKSNTKN